VTITISADLTTTEHIVEIRASNVTVSGFTVDGGGFKTDDLNVGIGANLVAPDVHLKGIKISENLVENVGDTALLLYQASGEVSRNRSTTAGFLGFNGSGSAVDGDAEIWITQNWFANKELTICTIGAASDLRGQAGELVPSGVMVHILNNYITDSKPFFDWAPGHALYFSAKLSSPGSNPASDATLKGEVIGNTVVNSGGAAMVVKPGKQDSNSKYAIELKLGGNTFEDNAETIHITFQDNGKEYTHNSSVKLIDVDDALPAEEIEAADLGPSENDNTLTVTNE
jgi:hypothetical protein